MQWWNVTKHIYSVNDLSVKFRVQCLIRVCFLSPSVRPTCLWISSSTNQTTSRSSWWFPRRPLTPPGRPLLSTRTASTAPKLPETPTSTSTGRYDVSSSDFSHVTDFKTSSLIECFLVLCLQDKHWLIRQAKTPMTNSSVQFLDDAFRKRSAHAASHLPPCVL